MCIICSLGDMLQALVANALLSGSLAPGNMAVEVVHGTGTPLGDPIEVSALSGALAAGRAPVPPVLASVKACLPLADALPLCRTCIHTCAPREAGLLHRTYSLCRHA